MGCRRNRDCHTGRSQDTDIGRWPGQRGRPIDWGPNSGFTADLIAEGDYVVGQWEGGGTHAGPAFGDFLVGSLPAATGRKMHFTGTTVLKVKNGKIVEEVGLDDGVTA